MDLFHVIEDAAAIIRTPRGVFRQSKMYHRGETLFVGFGPGFIRLTAKFDGHWGTSHPDVKVVEFDCPGATEGKLGPRYAPLPAKPVAIAA